MKKIYLTTLIFTIFSSTLNAIEISKSNINPNYYVILLGTYVGINDARRFANNFLDDSIYILKDEKNYTVRMVNIRTKPLALKKLAYIRKTVPDAILWKKMKFLQKNRFNKLNSVIYTIEEKK